MKILYNTHKDCECFFPIPDRPGCLNKEPLTRLLVLLGCITILHRCGILLQMVIVWSVALSVCHGREPCKNGCTSPDTIWDMDLGGPKEPYIR